MHERLIEILKYLLVGLVQGVGEILPISSSGHLVIVQNLLNIKQENLTVEVMLHIASLIALLFYFRKQLYDLICGFFGYIFKKTQDKKYFNWGIKIIIATIPAAIAGVLLEEYIEGVFSSLLSVGIGLLITAGLIFFTLKKDGNKKIEGISYFSVLLIGLFQSVAVLPGISRSGATMAGGRTQKLDKEEASVFAFMLFIPVSLGALVLKLSDIGEVLHNSPSVLPLVVSFITALVSTYLALKLIFNLIRKGKFQYFAYYCIAVGVFTIIYSFLK